MLKLCWWRWNKLDSGGKVFKYSWVARNSCQQWNEMKRKTTIRKVLSLVSFIASAGALTGRSFKTTTNTILTWAFWSSASHNFLLSWFVLQSKNNTALVAVANFQVFLVSNFAVWSLSFFSSYFMFVCIFVAAIFSCKQYVIWTRFFSRVAWQKKHAIHHASKWGRGLKNLVL